MLAPPAAPRSLAIGCPMPLAIGCPTLPCQVWHGPGAHCHAGAAHAGHAARLGGAPAHGAEDQPPGGHGEAEGAAAAAQPAGCGSKRAAVAAAINLLVAVGMAWWPSCGFGPSASVRAPAAHRSLSSIAAKQADHPITCISVSHLPACPTSQRMSRSCSTCLPFILACLPCPFRHRTSASKPRAAACSTAAS